MIRQADGEDRIIIGSIEKECFQDAWSSESIENQLKNDSSSAILFYEGNECCGFAIFSCLFDEGEILRIAVMPAHRRKGIAGEMMNEIFRICRGKGIIKLFLEVRSTNEPAKALYRAWGFEEIAVRKKYYGDCDGIVMVKNL